MKTTLLVLFLLLITTAIKPQVTQEWVARYNGPVSGYDGAIAIAVDNDGNAYVGGSSTVVNGTNRDFVIIKYNSAGVEQWVRYYNGPGNLDDAISSIDVDDEGNVFVSGFSKGVETREDITTIKYDPSGAMQWVRRYNGPANLADYAYSMAVDNLGDVIVFGNSQKVNDNDFVTIKYSSNGNEQWQQIYNGPDNSVDYPVSMAVDNAGNICVTGYSETYNVNGFLIGKTYTTVKYNNNGVQKWVKTYGTISEQAKAIAVDSESNVYVTGYSGGASRGVATVKYDSTGVQQWVQIYSEPGNNAPGVNSIAVDTEGNIYITGTSWGGNVTKTDIVTVKYNSAGEQQWVKKYNGPGSDYDTPNLIKTDETGNVYVNGYSYGIGIDWEDYTTIKYKSNGDTVWVQRYNGPGNSSDLGYGIAIDGNNNVYIVGSSYGGITDYDIATIKYSQFEITKPLLGSKFMAGEKDTIKWNGGKAGQVLQIEYSEDNGSTYNLIDIATPADSNYFIWDIPDNILTRKAKIKLTDIADPTITAVSDSFTIKGYVLTRLDANNQYVAFSPAAHGWQYTNGTLWPNTWWSQFNYSTATDPYTNEPYPSFFNMVTAASFVDWPLWVEVFGEDQCYWFTQVIGIGSSYKGKTQEKWKKHANPHNGSCFGFAASSFLAFNFRNQFFPKHPGIPNVDNIFNLNLTNLIQKTINGYYAFQFGKQSLDNDVIGQPKNPRTTLLEIMNMFKGDSLNIRTITIYNKNGTGGGAHTMAPISVTKDGSGPSRYRVNLYDSNNPGLNIPYIMVDSLNNTWTDFTGLGVTWTGNSHFYLEIPVSNYLNTPVVGKQLLKPKGIANIEFYNSEKANVMFTNSSGHKIGVTNGVVTDELQDGIAIFNKNGKPSDPIGYYIPDDNYSAVLSNITDTSGRAFFSAFKQDVVYNYERGNVNVSQSDKFRIDEGFSVISQDLEDKQINLSVIAKLDNSERILFVQQTQLKQNDSLYLRETNQSEFIIKNFGTSKTYKLEINERSSQEQEIFQNLSLSLQENSSHTIQPNWADLDGSILNILVDIGNDGTIDDTLIIENQVTGIGEDQGSLLTPNSFNLAQNYPNPFNPTTMISWQSPVSSHQTLKVYDVLGNEVATLVDEFREAGRYEVTFDASNLASGIYFYRLQAGSFVETKKMILLR